MSDESQGLRGAQTPNSSAGNFNAQMFVIMQALARVRTSQVVKVVAVQNVGDLDEVGFVDVQPMVHQLDGYDQPVPHAVVYGLPYFRMQGGANAVIIDPAVGDIGICLFADRDISSVKATKDFATPGSGRQFSMADGLYIGGVLNGTVQRYIRINDEGVEITSPQGLRINAETWLDGSLNVSGNVTVENGASGTFTTSEGLTVTVQDGIVTNIF